MFVEHARPVRTRALSGTRNDEHVTTLRVPEFAWVTGIRIRERYDVPCDLDLYWGRPVDHGVIWDETGDYIEAYTGRISGMACGTGAATRRELRVGIDNPVMRRTHALTGVRVCQSGQNDRVKGLQVQVAALEPTWESEGDRPRVIAGPRPLPSLFAGTTQTEEHRNCAKWDAVSSCRENEVVVGLEVHQTQRGGAIIGVQPICARIALPGGADPPLPDGH